MCFKAGGPEARCVMDPSYPLSIVPLGVFRRSEYSLLSEARAWMKEEVMRCRAGADGCEARMGNARCEGPELAFWYGFADLGIC